MSRKTDLQKYQEQIESQLKSLSPVFASAAIGDFSRNVKLPKHNSELTEFFVGVQIILDAIREKIKQLESSVKDLQAANKIIENEKARAEAILNSLADGLITIDKNGHTTFANEPAAKIIGPRARILGQDVTKLIEFKHQSGLDITKNENPFNTVLRQLKQVTVKLSSRRAFYLYNADNVNVRVAFTITPIRRRKQLLGAVIVFRDITDEAKADMAKSEIISLASHQLRTPLTTVKWYINELIRRRDLPGNKRKSYLAQIRQSNQRMIELVEHLLNVSRIELGTISINPEAVDVVSLIDAVLADLGIRIRQKDLKINKQVSDNPIAMADRDALRIVLQNIISNAAEYSYPSSAITIVVTKKDDHLLIRVADTGCGIPIDQQYHIFTKLFRATNANKLSTTGSGLGLYISKSLVERMNGKIWFTSTENIGTTMHIEIPSKVKGENNGRVK